MATESAGTAAGLPKKFQYDHALAKDEIRLILIHPGGWTDKINISILYKDEDESGIQYDALSYVWGSPANPVNISCDNEPFSVTQNLHKALLQLRENGLTTPIWIDAICINQSNADERTRQVRMMKRIYSQAETVHIWLGEASANTKDGVDLINTIARKIANGSTGPASHAGLFTMGSPEYRDTRWPAVADILTRPWFERIWVIQERTIARSCIYLCGKYHVSSDALQSLTEIPSLMLTIQARMMANKPQGVDGYMATMSMLSPIIAKYHSKTSLGLGELLILTNGFKATDPRDKVFALIGLTTGVPVDFIDYNKELKDVLMYLCELLLTRDSLRKFPALDVLSCVNHAHRALDLPSWVPEWDFKRDSFISLGLIVESREYIDVGEADFTVDDGEKIKITGRVIDKIQTLTEQSRTPGPNDFVDRTPAEIVPQILEWHDKIDAIVLSLDSYPGHMSPKEALWRAMCFNRNWNSRGIDEPAPPSHAYAYEAFKRVHAKSIRAMATGNDRSSMFRLLTSLKEDMETAKILDAPMSRCQAGRCFSVTENGYIGWCTVAAQEGDVVVAFRGTRLLFTLRPVGGAYKLTGDCYLQGLMEGEGLRMDDIEDEQLILV